MPIRFSILILAIVATLSADAPALPEASDKSAVNLQRYLTYRTGGFAFACDEERHAYRCFSRDQKLLETAEDNSTAEFRFKTLALRFGSAIALQLDKDSFRETIEEIRQSESERRKRLASNAAPLPLVSPRKKTLDRALFANLEELRFDDLSINTTAPDTTIRIGMLGLENRMKKTAKGVAFSERILGELRLDYRDVVVETNGSDSLYHSLPGMLETWLETNNSTRAAYVAQRLEQLYAQQLAAPMGGNIVVGTRYLGNDAIALSITAEQHHRAGASETSDLSGELHGISALFPPARKPAAPGQIDFLFRSMHSVAAGDGKRYRALLAGDERFRRYLGEYDSLIRSRLDRMAEPFRRNAEISGWFLQAKTAVSKLLTGQSDTLEIALVNTSGLTLLQLFNLLMSRLSVLPQQNGAVPPDPKRILTDTVSEHFDLRLQTH